MDHKHQSRRAFVRDGVLAAAGVAAGIGIAVVIGVVYWIVLALGLALGHSGALGPITAAWGSHVLFGFAGIFMLVKMDQ